MAAALRNFSCVVYNCVLCHQGKGDDTIDRDIELTLALQHTFFVCSDERPTTYYHHLTPSPMGGSSRRHTKVSEIPR
jgi:hypothetical protein